MNPIVDAIRKAQAAGTSVSKLSIWRSDRTQPRWEVWIDVDDPAKMPITFDLVASEGTIAEWLAAGELQGALHGARVDGSGGPGTTFRAQVANWIYT